MLDATDNVGHMLAQYNQIELFSILIQLKQGIVFDKCIEDKADVELPLNDVVVATEQLLN